VVDRRAFRPSVRPLIIFSPIDGSAACCVWRGCSLAYSPCDDSGTYFMSEILECLRRRSGSRYSPQVLLSRFLVDFAPIAFRPSVVLRPRLNDESLAEQS
jgi:hypothetical protein